MRAQRSREGVTSTEEGAVPGDRVVSRSDLRGAGDFESMQGRQGKCRLRNKTSRAVAAITGLVFLPSFGCSTSAPRAGAGANAGGAGAAAVGGRAEGGAGSDGGSDNGGSVSQAGASGDEGGAAGATEAGGHGGTGGATEAGSGNGGSAPVGHYPYPSSNYDEPYRGQFHFSAPAGYMNDVNGLWFWNGVYHLTYQSYAYTLSWGDYDSHGAVTRDWGHATSTDLIHWVNQGLMIEADVNSLGQAWSGSTVVDTDNTSGLQTGKDPVFVTIFTCTSSGTCLAFSNDRGATWTPYAANPLAIGGPTWDTRDPHVFWHAPTKRWVCVQYDQGLAIYTSPDLKTWTRRSHLDFGLECPDLYELPVDGNAADSKWVLQDASGAYLVGQFDGATFTPDASFGSEGAYKPQRIDVGPSYYASQTFNRATFPSSRVVQMTWLRGPDNVSAPWNQSTSFPMEIGLVSTPDGVRTTRLPISEIKSLYDKETAFGPLTLAQGQDLLSGISAKAMDYELTIDPSVGTAHAVTFRIADVTFAYDLDAHTLLDQPLPLSDGKVKIRVLADHSQLEVFGNDGLFSYTATKFFAPGGSSVSITADGTLGVVSGAFRSLKRVWPGAPAASSYLIDDGDATVAYTGSTTAVTDARYFHAGCHVLSGLGSTIQTTFTGTRIEWYGLKNVDLGKADVFMDGALAQAGVDLYDQRRQNAQLWSIRGLQSGAHTLKVVATGAKNPSSAGAALVHDYFVAYVDP